MNPAVDTLLRAISLALAGLSIVLLVFSFRRLGREARLTWLVPVLGALLSR